MAVVTEPRLFPVTPLPELTCPVGRFPVFTLALCTDEPGAAELTCWLCRVPVRFDADDATALRLTMAMHGGCTTAPNDAATVARHELGA